MSNHRCSLPDDWPSHPVGWVWRCSQCGARWEVGRDWVWSGGLVFRKVRNALWWKSEWRR